MKKYFMFAVAALTMVACSNDGSEPIETAVDSNVIRLSAKIAGATSTRANTTDAIQDQQFISGAEIFVEAYKTGESAPYASATYTTSDGDGTMTGTMYYPSGLENIDICAYYPNINPASTTSFTVQSSQTTADVANYRSSDLMYATKLTDQTKGSTHGLTFNHALSKIIVTLTAGNGLVAGDLDKVSAVKINGTKLTGTTSFSNGVISITGTSGDASDIDITGATKTNHAGIIIPQTINAGTTFITVTYNSVNYTYALTAQTAFAAGTVYTYALTLNATGVELSSTSITNWQAGTGGSGTITL